MRSEDIILMRARISLSNCGIASPLRLTFFSKPVIGRGGCILCKLEGFVGVYAFVADLDEGAQVTFLGYPHSCLLMEFTVEMIHEGHYSIIESLIQNGF